MSERAAEFLASCERMFIPPADEPYFAWARERLPEGSAGRVLDHTVFGGFIRGTSWHARALIMRAVRLDVPLVVPASAAMIAWSRRGTAHGVGVMGMMLDLPNVELDALDAESAFGAARLPAIRDDVLTDFATAHVVHVARTRGWPVVTTDATDIRRIDRDVEVDECPENAR
ncbi:MAG TPA: hypothetical protein VGF17_21420 [Phytomonospora sp.]